MVHKSLGQIVGSSNCFLSLLFCKQRIFTVQIVVLWVATLTRMFLEVVTNVSEEHAASIFTNEVIRMRMQPGHIDLMTTNTVIQK
jgi:hypothetical protein